METKINVEPSYPCSVCGATDWSFYNDGIYLCRGCWAVVKAGNLQKGTKMDTGLKKISDSLAGYKDLVLTIAGLIAIDHFIFGGKFRTLLKNGVTNAMSEVFSTFMKKEE